MLDQFRLGQKNRLAKRYLCKFFHEMSEIAYLTAEFACNVCFGDYENSFIFQSELDHKMDKKLRVAEIAARTGLSPSTVSRVLAGKANTSDKARRAVLDCEAVENAALSGMNLADGVVRITVLLKPEVFYKVLSEQTGLEIGDEAGLMPCIIELAKAKRAYEKIRSAMEQVEATGYGIVMPSIDELSLEQPEIVRQGGRYGVRLEASAPSIHMMKAVIHTELSPIVGTEKQSEDLVQSLLKDFEDDPVRLWESNIFGKSLHELVNDGLQNKLLHMPQEARGRLQETLERVINEGCTGLICILI